MKIKPIRRQAVAQEDGTWKVTVTPPRFTEFSPSSIILTNDQYCRYLQWQNGGVLIQNILHDLTPAQREILMTGIGPEEFDKAFRDE